MQVYFLKVHRKAYKLHSLGCHFLLHYNLSRFASLHHHIQIMSTNCDNIVKIHTTLSAVYLHLQKIMAARRYGLRTDRGKLSVLQQQKRLKSPPPVNTAASNKRPVNEHNESRLWWYPPANVNTPNKQTHETKKYTQTRVICFRNVVFVHYWDSPHISRR